MTTSTMPYTDENRFSSLLKGLKGAYASPHFIPDKESVKVWYQMLKDIPFEVLNLAVQAHIATNEFPPTIAGLRSKCADIMRQDICDWTEAWGNVLEVVGKYGLTNGREGMEQLDNVTAEAVRRVGYWAICNSENISIERANFRTAYEQIVAKEKEKLVLPTRLVERIAEQKNNCENSKLIVDKKE